MPYTRIAATRLWLSRVVIGNKLCPFAPPVSTEPKLRLRASAAADEAGVVADVGREALLLREGIRRPDAGLHETTLLVLSGELECCGTWEAFVQLSWRLQAEAIVANGCAEDLQVVLFHPSAVHSAYGEGPPDAADFAIRAPYPTVHLLREVDMLEAVKRYPDAHGIPQRNKARLRALGVEACEEQLAACVRAGG